jgi:hypothetical protein
VTVRVVLPRWLGVVSVVFAVPFAFIGLTGLPGFTAISTIYLVILSAGTAFGRAGRR